MKYLILLSSVLIHTCIGGLYAWSEFVPSLSKGYALSTAQTQVVFGCLIAVFTLSMIVAGRLIGFFGPRAVAIALSLGLSVFLLESSSGAIGLSALIGMAFGACFVVYAAQVGLHYGANHIASIYPLVFLGYGVSGLLGPWIGGWFFDVTKSYQGGLIVGVIVVISGLGLSHWLLRADGDANAKAKQQALR